MGKYDDIKGKLKACDPDFDPITWDIAVDTKEAQNDALWIASELNKILLDPDDAISGDMIISYDTMEEIHQKARRLKVLLMRSRKLAARILYCLGREVR